MMVFATAPFCVIGNSDRISYYTKKPSGQERTRA